MSKTHFVVKHPATSDSREFFWFGCSGIEAAQRAHEGFEVRKASHLTQAWDDMKKPKALVDYGNGIRLLSF